MGTVDLNDRLDDTLFYTLHAIQFFIQNPTRFFRINGFKIIALPLNVHHNGQSSLGMSALFRRYFMGAGYSKVSACPQADVIRQRSSCTVHKIRNALDTGQLHIIAGLFLFFIHDTFCRCVTGKQTFDHKLQKSVFCGKLGTATICHLSDLIHCITVFPVLPGQAYTDMVIAQPFQQAYKTGIHQQDICCYRSLRLFKFKRRLLVLIGKHTPGMMVPFPFAVIQNEDRFFRRSLRIIGCKGFVSANDFFFLCGCFVKIKYWHNLCSPCHWYIIFICIYFPK